MTASTDTGGRPLKFKTVEELRTKIGEYFASCWTQKIDMFGNPLFVKDKKGKKTDQPILVQFKPYTLTGLAVYLDCSRDTLYNYEKEKHDDLDEELSKGFSDTIKKAKEKIYAYAEEFLYSGKNPTGAIFNLKNNWGWQDKTEVDHTSKGKRVVGFNYFQPAKPEDSDDGNNNA